MLDDSATYSALTARRTDEATSPGSRRASSLSARRFEKTDDRAAQGAPVAHCLVARNGKPYSSPIVAVKRLEAEFPYVEADDRAGCQHVAEMVKKLAADKQAERDPSLRERASHLESLKYRAVFVFFGDDPSSDLNCLSTVLIPGEPLVFKYDSVEHEQATKPLLKRCADVLGYEITVDVPK